jgi:hypothetical protein
MATPAVAGAVALATQYFKDPMFFEANCHTMQYKYSNSPEDIHGYAYTYTDMYTDTYKYRVCAQGSFIPTGGLLKTVILHSGQPMSPSYAYPGPEQGFGFANLENVLLVDGNSGFSLYVDEYTLMSGKHSLFLWTVGVYVCTYVRILGR